MAGWNNGILTPRSTGIQAFEYYLTNDLPIQGICSIQNKIWRDRVLDSFALC